LVVVILGHAALLLNEDLYGLGDDEKDCFHQFATAISEYWLSCIMTLNPEDVLDRSEGWKERIPPSLVVWIEKCMNMGTSPASGIAQRLNTELMLRFMKIVHESELDLTLRLAASNEKFAAWVRVREALGSFYGLPQWLLMFAMCYSDDPALIIVGAERSIRTAILWDCHMGPEGANIEMGKISKREFGVCFDWIGGSVFLTGLIAFISGEKQIRILGEISMALRHESTVEQFEKLVGFLNHLICLLSMPYTVMYGLYGVLDAVRKEGLNRGDLAPPSAIRPMPPSRDGSKPSLLELVTPH